MQQPNTEPERPATAREVATKRRDSHMRDILGMRPLLPIIVDVDKPQALKPAVSE
jgi:hypothetical protein